MKKLIIITGFLLALLFIGFIFLGQQQHSLTFNEEEINYSEVRIARVTSFTDDCEFQNITNREDLETIRQIIESSVPRTLEANPSGANFIEIQLLDDGVMRKFSLLSPDYIVVGNDINYEQYNVTQGSFNQLLEIIEN